MWGFLPVEYMFCLAYSLNLVKSKLNYMKCLLTKNVSLARPSLFKDEMSLLSILTILKLTENAMEFCPTHKRPGYTFNLEKTFLKKYMHKQNL